MDFRIFALSDKPFRHLFAASEEELSRQGVQRVSVSSKPGFPCRVSLQDAEVGESVLLLNYQHLDADSPYRSSHAIFVREGATPVSLEINEIPDSIRIRLISVRAFGATGMMLDADIAEGDRLEPVLRRMLEDEAVAFLHLHNARRGCYTAGVERV